MYIMIIGIIGIFMGTPSIGMIILYIISCNINGNNYQNFHTWRTIKGNTFYINLCIYSIFIVYYWYNHQLGGSSHRIVSG